MARRDGSPATGSNRRTVIVGVDGPSGTGGSEVTGAGHPVSRRSKGTCRRGKLSSSPSFAPQVVASVSARASSSWSSWTPRSRMRRGSTSTTWAPAGSRSGSTRGGPSTNGSHDSMPSNCSPWARRSQTPTPHGRLRDSRSAAFATPAVTVTSRHPYSATPDRSRCERWSLTEKAVSRSTSSPHRSTRTGSSEVGGNTASTIPPRTANSRRSAVLDLVLAPVSLRHEPPEQIAHVDLESRSDQLRCRVLERPEPLEQRTHRGHHHPWRRERPVAAGQRVQQGEAPAHRLDLGADPLEGQGLPRRQHGDGTFQDTGGAVAGFGREQAAQVVGQPLGIEAGGGDDQDGASLAGKARRGRRSRRLARPRGPPRWRPPRRSVPRRPVRLAAGAARWRGSRVAAWRARSAAVAGWARRRGGRHPQWCSGSEWHQSMAASMPSAAMTRSTESAAFFAV